MGDIWVISDTHFGHENIIKYCDRPFENAHHMNEAILERWNSVVKPGDKVYHLGDVYFSMDWASFAARLNGSKRLVLGNHDNGKDQALQRTFKKIVMWRVFKEFGLLLTHVPVHPLSTKGLLNVHGHVHNNTLPVKGYKNVSVEVTNYTPVNIEQLRTT